MEGRPPPSRDDAPSHDQPSPIVLWLLFSPLVALLWVGALWLIWWALH